MLLLNALFLIVLMLDLNQSTAQLNSIKDNAFKDWFNEVTDDTMYQKWKKPPTDGKWQKFFFFSFLINR